MHREALEKAVSRAVASLLQPPLISLICEYTYAFRFCATPLVQGLTSGWEGASPFFPLASPFCGMILGPSHHLYALSADGKKRLTWDTDTDKVVFADPLDMDVFTAPQEMEVLTDAEGVKEEGKVHGFLAAPTGAPFLFVQKGRQWRVKCNEATSHAWCEWGGRLLQTIECPHSERAMTFFPVSTNAFWVQIGDLQYGSEGARLFRYSILSESSKLVRVRTLSEALSGVMQGVTVHRLARLVSGRRAFFRKEQVGEEEELSVKVACAVAATRERKGGVMILTLSPCLWEPHAASRVEIETARQASPMSGKIFYSVKKAICQLIPLPDGHLAYTYLGDGAKMALEIVSTRKKTIFRRVSLPQGEYHCVASRQLGNVAFLIPRTGNAARAPAIHYRWERGGRVEIERVDCPMASDEGEGKTAVSLPWTTYAPTGGNALCVGERVGTGEQQVTYMMCGTSTSSTSLDIQARWETMREGGSALRLRLPPDWERSSSVIHHLADGRLIWPTEGGVAIVDPAKREPRESVFLPFYEAPMMTMIPLADRCGSDRYILERVVCQDAVGGIHLVWKHKTKEGASSSTTPSLHQT